MCFLICNLTEVFSKLDLFIGKLVRKMNSNRFLSRLMDQNLIRISKISTLTFMPSIGTLT